ncbi:hypothetical protein Q8F55_008057 [Vanrija albida]|uniref:Uncharacterized protein n=1 Tax=Vanrija albida TaxID=181172 RepID=A0ABR3PV85_9TREE
MPLAQEWALPAAPHHPAPHDRRLLALSAAELRAVNQRLPPILPYTRFELSPAAPPGILAPLRRLTRVHEHYRATYEPLFASAQRDVVARRLAAWRAGYDLGGNGGGLGTAELVARACERGGKSVPSYLALERRSRAARTLKRLGIHPASVARPSPLRRAFAEQAPEVPPAPAAVQPSPDPIVFVGAFFELCDRTLPTRAPRRHARQRSNVWAEGQAGVAPNPPAPRAKTRSTLKHGRSRPAAPDAEAEEAAADVLDRGPWRKTQLGRQLDVLTEQLAALAASRRMRRRVFSSPGAAQRVPVV